MRYLTILTFAFVCACGTLDASGRDFDMNALEKWSQDLEDRKFPDFRSLSNYLQESNYPFEIYNADGNPKLDDSSNVTCKELESILDGYVIISPNIKENVFRRYKITKICGKHIYLEKDFGYKNPYQ